MSEKGEREQSGVGRTVTEGQTRLGLSVGDGGEAERGEGANVFGTQHYRTARVWKFRRFWGLKLLCVGRSEKRSVGQQPYVNVATDVVNVL